MWTQYRRQNVTHWPRSLLLRGTTTHTGLPTCPHLPPGATSPRHPMATLMTLVAMWACLSGEKGVTTAVPAAYTVDQVGQLSGLQCLIIGTEFFLSWKKHGSTLIFQKCLQDVENCIESCFGLYENSGMCYDNSVKPRQSRQIFATISVKCHPLIQIHTI